MERGGTGRLDALRLTAIKNGLLIEAIDYHAEPPFLDTNALAKFGIRLEHEERAQ